jgi:predicted nucleic acid-binding Zn ribbon protein
MPSGKKTRKMVVPNIFRIKTSRNALPVKTSRPKGERRALCNEQQEFLDVANLLPPPPEPLKRRSWLSELDTSNPDYFEDELDANYPVEKFPELRAYVKNPDPRRPELKTPKQRLDWVEAVNKTLRAHAEARAMPFPWAEIANWKPTGACVVCGKLFSITRRDKTTCSDPCAHIQRQRDYRKRQEQGRTKVYDAAKKRKRVRKQKQKGAGR